MVAYFLQANQWLVCKKINHRFNLYLLLFEIWVQLYLKFHLGGGVKTNDIRKSLLEAVKKEYFNISIKYTCDISDTIIRDDNKFYNNKDIAPLIGDTDICDEDCDSGE